MGLLDDAIREHLELKRRRGADPTEVSRQESEALGPVRREPDPGDESADEEPLAHEDEAVPAAYEDEPLAGDEPYADQVEEPPLVEEPGFGAPYDAGLDGGEPTQMMEPPPPPPPEPASAEPPAAEPPAAEPPPAAGQETEEWGFDDEPEPASEEPAEPDEDVLEETPEFLQETPEHDRLWFEQKPPRDFDFDG